MLSQGFVINLLIYYHKNKLLEYKASRMLKGNINWDENIK